MDTRSCRCSSMEFPWFLFRCPFCGRDQVIGRTMEALRALQDRTDQRTLLTSRKSRTLLERMAKYLHPRHPDYL